MPTLLEQADGLDWIEEIVEKLSRKHNIQPYEVEECFDQLKYKIRTGRNNTYYLYSQSHSGRYLFIVFVWRTRLIRVISARDMDPQERVQYRRK
ncbi:MAG: BrnT family toxin [Chloroflexota bacterium]|nr:BrnT family toxin [Chloroflexota bacterium]